MSTRLLDKNIMHIEWSEANVHFETAQQEVEAIQKLAKQIGANWSNPKNSLEILEEMREESSCRCTLFKNEVKGDES